MPDLAERIAPAILKSVRAAFDKLFEIEGGILFMERAWMLNALLEQLNEVLYSNSRKISIRDRLHHSGVKDPHGMPRMHVMP